MLTGAKKYIFWIPMKRKLAKVDLDYLEAMEL